MFDSSLPDKSLDKHISKELFSTVIIAVPVLPKGLITAVDLIKIKINKVYVP